jgi:SAM-dependent methyltransferase
VTDDDHELADAASATSDVVLVARRIASIAFPRVLEIGAFDGRTTRVLAEAAASRGGTVVVIDPMQWDPEDAGLSRRRAPRARFWLGALDRMVAGTSYEAAFWRNVGARADCVTLFRGLSTAPALIASGDPALAAFDVALLDGDHAYDAVHSDLTEWGSRVRPGGTLYVRDAAPEFRGLERALAEHATSHGVTVLRPHGGSLAVVDVTLRAVTHRGPRLLPRLKPR